MEGDGEKVKLAITPGDPAGIGPEITAKLLTSGKAGGADFVIVGSALAVEDFLPPHKRGEIPVISWRGVDELEEISLYPTIIDTGEKVAVSAGSPSDEGGKISGLSVEVAANLARRGIVDGMVTGPISKEALNRGGYRYSGHTEMLAEIFDSPECQMMMVSGQMRVVILTRDIPLHRVPENITRSRLRGAIVATHTALRRFWSIKSPFIAVAALNPHAGDGGVIGTEEMDIISPEIEYMRGEGYDLEGPVPADTLFYMYKRKGYHACIALYHDQGMIPFKMSGFEDGVNMTIGLPIVRTSVCHGTAYDIAGKGKGSAKSLEAAVGLARECVIASRERLGQGGRRQKESKSTGGR
jgi:4-hydroxythreonine-4-phosphate dehydrogenase